MIKNTNRLAGEKSPYLLQHAHNPVDWYPWGEEAFARASRDDKPIFLSIGYSTCHWCHVMERESFSDEATARLLNETFVCIKVDREERPDLDQYYMAVCQALTGSGGWPLTIIMTSDKKPFFAGTYFPKAGRWGREGLLELVPRVREYWAMHRTDALHSADEIAAAVAEERESGKTRRPAPEIGPGTLDAAYAQLEAAYDRAHGGFGAAPKFPTPHTLTFLLRIWMRSSRAEALHMVEKTLAAMRLGGIYDQLGGGFHRYSTDVRWLVPHFEKMLYDQALLAHAYTSAFLATGKAEYRQTALGILDYVLRDLASPEGGFYSAEDADSDGEEGKFYVWTGAEIRSALGDADADFAAAHYGVRPEGNFAEPGRGPDGRNVLHLRGDRPSEAADQERLETIRGKLLAARDRRNRPFMDTKVLADWNGLAIGALAAASRIADDPRYARAATRAAEFVLDRMRDGWGGLLHVYSGSSARIPAFLDDYAFVIAGLIELYFAAHEPRVLESALALTEGAIAHFWDGEAGGFFFARSGSELPFRKKESYDGAIPSGNSGMLLNLLRLARSTGRTDLEEKAAALTGAFANQVASNPWAHTAFLSAVDFAYGPSQEIVVAGRRDDPQTLGFFDILNTAWLPNAVVLFKPVGEEVPLIDKLAPFTSDMTEVDGRPTAYVCSGGRCLSPVTSAEGLRRAVETAGRPRADKPSV